MTSTLLLSLLLSAAGPVAAVDGVSISGAELSARISATRAAGGDATPSALVEDLINEVLLAADARKRGLADAPEVKRAVERARRRAAAELFVERQLNSTQIADAELWSFYKDTQDTVELLSIVYASREEAEAGVARLNGGTAFSEEARRSLDPKGKAAGGALGTLQRRGLDPALAKLAFDAPLNTLQGPVALELGFAVVKVKSRQLADDAGFQARKEELRRFFEQQARTFARQHYVTKLRAKYKVVLDEDFLRRTRPAQPITAEDRAHVLATVKGTPVVYGDIADDLQRIFGASSGGHGSGFTVKAELAWARIDAELLAEAAIENGEATDPSVAMAAAAAEQDALVRALVARLRAEAGTPDADALARFHRTHAAEYTRPAARPCAHLLVPTKEQAERLRADVGRGKAFDALARMHSIDRMTSRDGGSLGLITEEHLARLDGPEGEPEIARLIRSTPANEVTRPVRGSGGWHLLRCGPVTPAALIPLTEVEPQVRERATRELQDAAVSRRITELRQVARISIDTLAVASAR